jgi:hypothetical protein
MVMDNAYVLARRLLDELSSRLDTTRAGQVEKAVVHPGNMVPQYGCSLAAVRIVNITAAAATTPSPCPPGWFITFEMTVDRCYRTPDDNSMPPVPVLDSASRDMVDDADAMRAAALCAFERRQIGTWTPRGPSGGIHGGTMAVTVTSNLHCKCEVVWPSVDELIAPLPGDPRIP